MTEWGGYYEGVVGVVGRPCRNGRLVVPVVPSLARAEAGEEAGHRGGALRQDRDDHEARAEQELCVYGGQAWVVRELPSKGTHDGGAFGVGIPESSVDVGE